MSTSLKFEQRLYTVVEAVEQSERKKQCLASQHEYEAADGLHLDRHALVVHCENNY
jgi:hypothetical protein